MNMKSESTIFFKEFLEVAESYASNDDQLTFLKMVINYGLGKANINVPPRFKPAFIMVQATIDKSQEKYKTLIAARSEAGKKGSEKRWNKYSKEQEEVFVKIIQLWNSIEGVTQIKKITDERKEKLAALLADYEIADFEKVKKNIQESDFLKGKNSQMWFITFDWLIEIKNFCKVLEGNYNKSNDTDIEKIWI